MAFMQNGSSPPKFQCQALLFSHLCAAGTATPRSYEFAWNDDVIAMNQFAGVLTNATEGVAAALNTQGDGVPLVIFNPLNVPREDVVEAEIHFPDGMPSDVRVVGPDGKGSRRHRSPMAR